MKGIVDTLLQRGLLWYWFCWIFIWHYLRWLALQLIWCLLILENTHTLDQFQKVWFTNYEFLLRCQHRLNHLQMQLIWNLCHMSYTECMAALYPTSWSTHNSILPTANMADLDKTPLITKNVVIKRQKTRLGFTTGGRVL